MKLKTLNKYLRWFGLVLVIGIPDSDEEPLILFFERARKWPLSESQTKPMFR